MMTHWSSIVSRSPGDASGRVRSHGVHLASLDYPGIPARYGAAITTSRGFRRCAAAATGVDHEGHRFESCAGPRCEFLQRSASQGAGPRDRGRLQRARTRTRPRRNDVADDVPIEGCTGPGHAHALFAKAAAATVLLWTAVRPQEATGSVVSAAARDIRPSS
jgi:hypothetical protein